MAKAPTTPKPLTFSITFTKFKLRLLLVAGLISTSFTLALATGFVLPWALVACMVTGIFGVFTALFTIGEELFS